MSDTHTSAGSPTGAPQDGVSVLQNIARQIGVYAQSIANAYPAATTTASPQALGFNNISITATAVLSTSSIRHGLIFHNPGTYSVYVFPSAITTSPTTAAVGGSFIIPASGSLTMSPAVFPNLNAAWKAFSGTGGSQPLTILEFY